jgi:hypothetical protein
MMVGNDHSPWELLQDYDSDEGDNSMASISDDEEPPALPPTSNASGSDKPPSKAEYKLALKTVLKVLDYDDEEVERHSRRNLARRSTFGLGNCFRLCHTWTRQRSENSTKP